MGMLKLTLKWCISFWWHETQLRASILPFILPHFYPMKCHCNRFFVTVSRGVLIVMNRGLPKLSLLPTVTVTAVTPKTVLLLLYPFSIYAFVRRTEWERESLDASLSGLQYSHTLFNSEGKSALIQHRWDLLMKFPHAAFFLQSTSTTNPEILSRSRVK